VLGKAGAELEVGQVLVPLPWRQGVTVSGGLAQPGSESRPAPGSASPTAELSKSGVLFRGCLLQ